MPLPSVGKRRADAYRRAAMQQPPAPPVSHSSTLSRGPMALLKTKSFPMRRMVFAFLATLVLCGGAFWTWETLRGTRGIAPGAGYQNAVSTAMQYVQELQQGQYEKALFRVAWVQERLARERAAKGNGDADNTVLRALASAQAPTERSRAVLEQEGIEDTYIFVPRAEIVVAGADGGRIGLERPTAGRAWLAVSYPDPSNAPKDETGRPIRGLTVGLNLSEDGYVLKAEIIGNLEIDRYSIRYF